MRVGAIRNSQQVLRGLLAEITVAIAADPGGSQPRRPVRETEDDREAGEENCDGGHWLSSGREKRPESTRSRIALMVPGMVRHEMASTLSFSGPIC